MALEPWPALHLEDWSDTKETLHRMAQVVGKIRLARAHPVNHWWQVPLYVTARGLTTSTVPDGERLFEIRLDLVAHEVRVETSDGARAGFALEPMAVADFHDRLLGALGGLGIAVSIRPATCEIPDERLGLDEDRVHASYDAAAVRRFFQVLARTSEVMARARGRFLGKASPIQFFWGSFDLALTFFSGRRAPERAGADAVTREAYSHEVVSVGFWPGGGGVDASFYAYAAPEPPGFADGEVAGGRYDPQLKEFLLPYEAVRRSGAPDQALLAFFESAYALGAELGRWDRQALERPEPASRAGSGWAAYEPAGLGLS
ncbi:DUF5996 family protein [Anaeromyxobacter paludicola]|uniref:Ava_C0101 and related proteins n=1 Tax=Anaeromyxobacter paludicola TaxID=2918171 RepID=A0ABM7XG77_9BACT|nr:DUF5996 family protein [Anaeromyxobacter paludicola]BDG10836.1 hypothetical protein AMPC_39490 [Anaeromyxobacter paludicola]